MRRVLVLVGIALVLVVGVLAIPVKQTCGVPDYTCATAPDAQGNVHYYYEVEPLIAQLTESVTGSNFPFHYTSGYDLKKVG